MSPDPVEGFGGFMVGRFEQTMNCLDSMQVIDTVNIQRLVLDRLSVFPSDDRVARQATSLLKHFILQVKRIRF